MCIYSCMYESVRGYVCLCFCMYVLHVHVFFSLKKKNLNEYDLKDPGPRKSLIYSSHTNPKWLESKSQPRETQPENGKGALGVNTLSPILEPEKNP